MDDGRDVRVVAARTLLALSGVTFSASNQHFVLDFAPAPAAT